MLLCLQFFLIIFYYAPIAEYMVRTRGDAVREHQRHSMFGSRCTSWDLELKSCESDCEFPILRQSGQCEA